MSKDPCKPNTSPKPSSRLTCCLTISHKGGSGDPAFSICLVSFRGKKNERQGDLTGEGAAAEDRGVGALLD